MPLTPDQKAAVASWVVAGDNLSTVQKKLTEKFQVSLTYRDVRFLVDDLNLELKDPAPKVDLSDVSKTPPKPADATVFRIDRTCSFTRVYQGGPEKKPSEQVEQDCSATDEFKAIASSAKRQKDVDGKAVVKVSYTAPQDHGYHTGELRFDGHDDQFYALMAGDTVKILVANKNPDKIRLD